MIFVVFLSDDILMFITKALFCDVALYGIVLHGAMSYPIHTSP